MAPKIRVFHANHQTIKAIEKGSEKRALLIVKYKGIRKMITVKILRFPFVVCVSHTVNELVTDIILIITSQEDLLLTLLHIGSRLLELFSKEVRVKKQPGRPLNRAPVLSRECVLRYPKRVIKDTKWDCFLWNPDRAMHFTIAPSYHRLVGRWCDGAMVRWRWRDDDDAMVRWRDDDGAMERRRDNAMR